MEEPIVEVVPKTEDVVPKTEEVVEKNSPIVEAPAAKSKGGRPAGAKDKAPRKKKIVIVEEPVAKASPEVLPPKPVEESVKPAPVEDIKHVEPELVTNLPSPRSVIRESARHMLELKRLNDTARKSHLQNAYTRRLAFF